MPADAAAVTYRYKLEAADGMPADFRVALAAVTSGSWQVRADWSGRGIAGLWLVDDDGEVLLKRIAASPLELAFEVEERWTTGDSQLFVRFATTTDSGELDGFLEVIPPALEDTAESGGEQDGGQVSAVRGPGQCLAPAFRDEAHGRALERLAKTLESAGTGEAAWCLEWVHRLVETVTEKQDIRARRAAVDFLWENLLEDRGHRGEVGHALRELLSTVEDLVRRESLSPQPSRERGRQDALFERLGCLPNEPSA